MSDRFRELVDDPALSPDERERLRRVHDLLLDVGPPPEVPEHLRPPEPSAQVLPLRRRRRGPLLLAAALALAAVGAGGYLLGDRAAQGEQTAEPPRATAAPGAVTTVTEVTTVTTAPATTQAEPPRGPLVAMTGVGAAEGAWATVEILPRASSGDYPVRLEVSGLPAGETYELWVIDDGELDQLCGRFRTGEGLTDTIVTVPYEMRTRDDWVIVRPGTTEPLLRT